MENIWILVIGSGDVQLKTKEHFGRSVKFLVAQKLPGKIKNLLDMIPTVYTVNYWNWH